MMTIPKVSEGVAENVDREARRDILRYVKEKAVELNKENPVLSAIVHALATDLDQCDEPEAIYQKAYFSMLLVLNIVNTQLEVNELKEIWG